MSEVKIARFVGIDACKSIFSEKSTFVLRSPEHYRRLYESSGGTKGDRDEGSAKTVDGGTAEFTGFIMSCWTRLECSEPTRKEWDIFKENRRNIVAIVSTPSKVCDFLNRVLKIDEDRKKSRFPFIPVVPGEVKYKRPVNINNTNISDIVSFTKDEKFTKENEYRFVLTYTWPNVIDSFIFCGGIEYMEKCFANPEISKENKKELLLILMNAMCGYGDFEDKEMCEIIDNADILFE
ncbi:MAG: hypothetical protein ACYSWZ_11470 [Planctomycetota bacterium]|jgi:hypothetical protein